eukprot:NODE_6690_length_494_cov_20.447191_g5902_i0.p1 GENE.NODE_6690_length_494_cov_20.447191_g5902_i0~~NODE_6690_length_494_cov_20.447191_g5902_i0.p1  ORF type:complete len:132 (-),score=45.99 NODE_6690_length_494_cov_20.447191_g5902_i0:99-473(-)
MGAREKVGLTDATTNQPVKGRKKGGGVKVGEMERDALLSHGCVNLVLDRLFSHGLHHVDVCLCCGSFLTLDASIPSPTGDNLIQCTHCQSTETRQTQLPFAFIYMCVELMALNIEVCLDIKTGS